MREFPKYDLKLLWKKLWSFCSSIADRVNDILDNRKRKSNLIDGFKDVCPWKEWLVSSWIIKSKEDIELFTKSWLDKSINYTNSSLIKFLVKNKIILDLSQLKTLWELFGILDNSSLSLFKLLYKHKIIINFDNFQKIIISEGWINFLRKWETWLLKIFLNNWLISNNYDFVNSLKQKIPLNIWLTKLCYEFLVKKWLYNQNPKDLEDLFFWIDIYNIQRVIWQKLSLYEECHPLVIAFATYEDQLWSVKKIDEQVRKAIDSLKEDWVDIDSLPLKEQFEMIINFFKPWANVDYESEGKYFWNKKTLFLYVRQWHWEMCSFRFCMMAKMIKDKIDKWNNPVFNKVQIVPFDPNLYPRWVNILWFSSDDIRLVRWQDFINLWREWNMVFINHWKSKEFSWTLVTWSTWNSKDKVVEWDYIQMNLNFDKKDWLTPRNYPWYKDDLANSVDLRKMLEVFSDWVKRLTEFVIEKQSL